MLYSQALIERTQTFIYELSVVVCYHRSWEAEFANYLLEEILDLPSDHGGESFSFHPFREVIGRDQDELLLSASDGEGSHNVHSPLGERPWRNQGV